MTYIFHPAAEAEFLESVGYYESEVAGLGGAFKEEFEALADSRFWLSHITGDAPITGWAGFNNRLHGDRLSAASPFQTGA